ncbi:type II toxin-antitoxin system ParD family antitoxin [Paracoccus kondratievae]|uniref:type II toxin-antitoxin system ParD family antitoxin n=1 Tax=Paracoccus kondratievae TaxID=135740 RepID=UPI001D0D16D3|nr:type II toxin-antitoxin system ParD family antitoxin [Paracoccus kondratievae]
MYQRSAAGRPHSSACEVVPAGLRLLEEHEARSRALEAALKDVLVVDYVDSAVPVLIGKHRPKRRASPDHLHAMRSGAPSGECQITGCRKRHSLPGP